MKKKTEPYEYKTDFIIRALSYIDNYDNLEIDTSLVHNLTAKEKEMITKLNILYSKIKLLKDYKIVQLERLSASDALLLANNFLINIFPKYKGEILALDSIIDFGNYSIHEAGLTYRLIKNKIEFGTILIPESCNNYIVSVIVHEKMHAIIFNHLNLINLFSTSLEFLPVLLSKIALVSLDDELAIKYDEIVRINDTKQNLNSFEIYKYIKNNPNKSELDMVVCDYLRIISYDYLISELYTNILMKYYMTDSTKMIKKLNLILAGKITIQQFWDSYNIDLQNKELIPAVKEETSKCKRIVIMP